MGTIYRNGVPFVGSGGAGGVEMTQAEYDLLPTSEKMNGAIYFITDGDVSYPSASQMRYDNTESQIPATTVQGAIDENRIEINTLNTGLSQLIKFKTIANAICDVNGLYFIPSSVVDPANHEIIGIYDNSGNAWISGISVANGMYGVRYTSYNGTNMSNVSATLVIAYVHK